MPPVPYVDETTIRNLALTPAEILDAVREAFRQRADGRASLAPKVGIYPPGGGLFHAMPAALSEIAVVKWLTEGPRPLPGRPRLKSTLLANDPKTGELLAVLDAAYLTGVRTAAVTALALQLAPPESTRSVAFVGAGLQAHVHAQALASMFAVEQATVMSRTPQSARRLIDALQDLGIRAREGHDPRQMLQEADLVVSGVPFVERIEPFLDAGDLAPRAVAAAVDLGRSWLAGSYRHFGRRLTDDRAHTAAFLAGGLVDDPGPFDADLPELLRASGARAVAAGPTLIFTPGVAIADAAVALLVLRRLGLLPA